MAEVSRADWLATVISYVGTPYHHQGRAPGVGMDCPAPIVCAAWATGIKPASFDVRGYSREPDGTLERLCREHMEPIELANALPGDVILGAFGDGPAQHLGVLTDANPSRRYWVQAEGHRHQRVMHSRLVLDQGGRAGLRVVGAFHVPGVA